MLNYFLSTRIYVKIALILHWNDFSWYLWGNVCHRAELQKDEKNEEWNQENESALYMKSLSMPLTKKKHDIILSFNIDSQDRGLSLGFSWFLS